MIDVVFVGVLGLLMGVVLHWGCKALPEERWQMIASVPLVKQPDGEWKGVNLTFYGFFSATGSVFGISLGLLLFASIHVSITLAVLFAVMVIAICLPASRIVAARVEKKSSTFTIAGAAFVAALGLPPVVWAGHLLAHYWDVVLDPLAVLAATAIAYALAEAIGRLACMSFGCCYGMPVRDASPWLRRLFRTFNTVFHGTTKKAAYASGLQEEPLVPVQALTSIVFTSAGLVGLCLYLTQCWRAALLVPVIGTWGWRAIAENLRADHRGHRRVSAYQVMSLIAMIYLALAAFLLPKSGPAPDLAFAFSQVVNLPVIIFLQALWILLFLYYGRSRVTSSLVSFHVVTERT